MLTFELIQYQAQHNPDLPALVYRDEVLNYQQLNTEVSRIAQLLKQYTLAIGDGVAVYLPKQPEAVVGMFASNQAGGMFIPVNPILKAQQVVHILNDSGAKFLLTSSARVAQLGELLRQCPALEYLLLVDTLAETCNLPVIQWQETATAQHQVPRIKENDLAALLYTSGSTGLPKGVMLSHRNLLLGASSVTEYLAHQQTDRILAVLPFSFDYGLSQLTIAFTTGSCVVLMDYLMPRDVLRAVIRYKVTGLAAIPTLWNALSRLDWSDDAAHSLRYITSSGGAMPATTTQLLQKKLPDTDIYLMYGLTEAFRSTYVPADKIDQHLDAMGIAIPHAELHVLDENNQPCPPDMPGQLVHAGALVSQGYWQDPQKTAEKFAYLPGTDKPAVWSGDQVKKDAQGYFYFLGRMDEMIKTSGYRVSPAEVESVVQQITGNQQIAAIGVAHAELGQAILLVTDQTKQADQQARILKHCKQHLPTYMLPQAIIEMKNLPMNANHKIDRVQLQQQFKHYFSL